MEKNTVLRWVKASERLPEEGGYYFLRMGPMKDKLLLPRQQLIEKWRIWSKNGAEIEWLEEAESPAPLSAATELRLCGDVSREEMVDKVREFLDDELDVTTDNWGHYVGTKGKDEAASRIAALLSQRQPVAPEREDGLYTIHDVVRLIHQWDMHINQHEEDRGWLVGMYEFVKSKSASPSAENKGGEG